MAAGRTQARFALWIRALGATGLFVALLGLVPLATAFDLRDFDAWGKHWTEFRTDLPTREFRDGYVGTGFLMLVVGGCLAVVSLLYLFLNGIGTLAGRRNFARSNSALQVALAVVLLVGVNVYSFRHYLRVDCTRDRQFTLPVEIAGELRKLRSETTIVVYQRYKTFSRLSEKPDANDYAASRKVVEKVQDLVEQFRELGPQFKVEILDVEAKGYDDKYAELTKTAPMLKEALESAPENSIVFHAARKIRRPDGQDQTVESVQRLGFNEFYQLDKTRSQELANLVLLPQGVGPFAGKVLAVEERKPKIGFAVIHEYLSSEGPDEYALAGAKKALQAQGFDVVDFVLKKWGGQEPEPAAYTLDESKLEGLEEMLAEADASIAEMQKVKAQLTSIVDYFRTTPLDELTRKFRDQLGGRPFTEEMRKPNLDRYAVQLETVELAIKQNSETRKQIEAERDGLTAQERLADNRLEDNLRTKMLHLFAGCDLLIVPRMTLRDVIANDVIRSRLYKLDDIQNAAVKEFLKAGKPVLACFGPTAEPVEARRPQPPAGPDGLEELLGQLGIRFGKQTILFDSDSKSFAERRTNLFATGSKNKPPAVAFAPIDGHGAIFAPDDPTKPPPKTLPPGELASGLAVVKRNVGGKEFDLELKHPRPVYFVPPKATIADIEAGFLFTDPKGWNEDQPFQTRERTPRFEPPKPDDPAKNTPEEKRFGSFPVGVAVETTVPADWYAAGEKPATVRVSAIGHGGLFVGPKLTPPQEVLLVSVANWLLGRDERLPREAAPWTYPRVKLETRERTFWTLGTMLVLPGTCLFLGALVLLGRRYR